MTGEIKKCIRSRQLRHVLHRCDRAMIYIFIAGSYFPWLTILELPTHGWSSYLKWCVWLLAILGITYQQTFHEKYKCLETIFYLIMGLGPSVLIMIEVGNCFFLRRFVQLCFFIARFFRNVRVEIRWISLRHRCDILQIWRLHTLCPCHLAFVCCCSGGHALLRHFK